MSFMPSPERPGRSYEDIARTTVPLPDSSYQPTDAEKAASEEPHLPAVTGSEVSVQAALAALSAVDLTDLQVVVTGSTATMSGSVARRSDRDQIEAALRGVDGIAEVDDRVRIRLD